MKKQDKRASLPLEKFRQRHRKRIKDRQELLDRTKDFVLPEDQTAPFVRSEEQIADDGRLDLIELYCECLIDLDEAEAEAQRHGFSPILPKPSVDAFDPRKANYWSFPMVVAWVVWRSFEEVRNQCDTFRGAFFTSVSETFVVGDQKKGITRKRRSIRPLEPATCRKLEVYDSSGWGPDHRRMSIAEAQTEILAALRSDGGPKAFARPLSGAGPLKPMEVPTVEWTLLDFWDDPHHGCIGLKFDGDSRSAYLTPAFSREAVVAHWRARDLPEEGKKWPVKLQDELIAELQLQPLYDAFATERIKAKNTPTEADDQAWVSTQLHHNDPPLRIARELRKHCDLAELHKKGPRGR